MPQEGKAVLIATLGTEPQVLTLSLQELLSRGERIVEAVGVHSRGEDPAIVAAVERLRREWSSLPFGREVELKLVEVPVADFDSERSLQLLYRRLKDLVASSRSRGLRVHLNLSGGRKPMGICALLVAQLLFGPEDRLWYLISSSELVESRALTAERHEYRLVEIPVPLWTEAEAFLDVLSRYEDPWAAVELQRRLKHWEEVRQWRHFFENVLRPAERKVVKELALRGGTNRDIAQRLWKSPHTVEHQLESESRKLRAFLHWPQDFPMNRTTLVSLLSSDENDRLMLEYWLDALIMYTDLWVVMPKCCDLSCRTRWRPQLCIVMMRGRSRFRRDTYVKLPIQSNSFLNRSAEVPSRSRVVYVSRSRSPVREVETGTWRQR